MATPNGKFSKHERLDSKNVMMRIIDAILWSMVLIFLDSLETQNHGFTPFHKWFAVLQFIFELIDYKS
jgi:hypothetical protein